jgi:hypothetical protein
MKNLQRHLKQLNKDLVIAAVDFWKSITDDKSTPEEVDVLEETAEKKDN